MRLSLDNEDAIRRLTRCLRGLADHELAQRAVRVRAYAAADVTADEVAWFDHAARDVEDWRRKAFGLSLTWKVAA